ncbi:unnamed protein product [Microthlaspi erraticum]|uniref:Aspartic peptidase DDI1-type domain-containing protein n=1 Tax=Microthlaspi erraticum TaxID=1685480 RepID=A0A6D2KYN0_9BRAS|nr:unnamed protein product [Microthlaspi erraticum]
MANIDKVSEVLKVSTHQINLLTSPTFLPKVKDQGKFTLPCTLGHIELDNALVDSSASINLISSNGRKAWHCWSIAAPYYFNHENASSKLITVMEMEEEKDLPLLLGTPFLSTVGASIDFHKQEVILHKVDKEPRVVRDKVEKDQRVDKDQGLRNHALRGLELRDHDLIGHELIGLFKHLVSLMKESLQALFDEPLGSAQKEGEDAASKALVGEKRKNPSAQIEYKIRYKGRSRPFSRAKALVTSEQSRDPTKLKELLSQVLTITLDGGTSSTNA